MNARNLTLSVAVLGLWSCTKMNFAPTSQSVDSSGITPATNPTNPQPTVSPTPGVSPSPTVPPGPGPTPTPTVSPGPGPSPTPTVSPGPGPTVTPKPVVSPTPTCTPNVANIYRQTKILFIVDTSASNVLKSRLEGTQECRVTDKDYASCTPATDPNKTFRDGSLQNFFSTYSYKSNFDWGLITFSGTTAQSLISSSGSSSEPVFSTQASDFQNALNVFKASADSGATPYQAAIQLAGDMIQSDPDLNSGSQPDYVLIFLTDGYPTDYGAYKTGVLDTATLKSDLRKVLAIAPGRVTLSTVYYGTVDDPHAISLLHSLADLGKGQFANVKNTTGPIKIDDLLPPQVNCAP